MDEATQNAIAEATTRLDQAADLRSQVVEQSSSTGLGLNYWDWADQLTKEAQAWASLAVAAAIAGSAPQMPSIADIMSQMTGGVQ